MGCPQRLLGHLAQVSVLSVNRGEPVRALAGEFRDEPIKTCAADPQHPLFVARKRPAGQKNRRVNGIFQREGTEKLCDEPNLFQLLRGCRHGIRGFDKRAHGYLAAAGFAAAG